MKEGLLQLFPQQQPSVPRPVSEWKECSCVSICQCHGGGRSIYRSIQQVYIEQLESFCKIKVSFRLYFLLLYVNKSWKFVKPNPDGTRILPGKKGQQGAEVNVAKKNHLMPLWFSLLIALIQHLNLFCLKINAFILKIETESKKKTNALQVSCLKLWNVWISLNLDCNRKTSIWQLEWCLENERRGFWVQSSVDFRIFSNLEITGQKQIMWSHFWLKFSFS